MTGRATQDGQRWPQRPAIRARYDAAAREAGYGDLEAVLADTGLADPEAGRLLGRSAQTVDILRRQRGLSQRKQIVLVEPERGRVGKQMRARYESGETIRTLAAETGYSFGRIRSLLLEAGTELRPRWRQRGAT